MSTLAWLWAIAQIGWVQVIAVLLVFSILNGVAQRVLTPHGLFVAYAMATATFLWWLHASTPFWVIAGIWLTIYGVYLGIDELLTAVRDMHREQMALLRCINENVLTEHSDSR
jgi:hypothetical protein